MAQSAVMVLFDMMSLLIGNTVGTVFNLMALFGEFLSSMGVVVGSGFGGFLIGALLIGVVLFFLAKFVFAAGKTIIILIAAAVLILLMVIIGSA